MKEPMEVSRVTSGGPPSALAHIVASQKKITETFARGGKEEEKMERNGLFAYWAWNGLFACWLLFKILITLNLCKI